MVAAKVRLKNEEAVTILSVYRPPGSNQSDTLKDLNLIISLLGNQKVVITGDFNIDLETLTTSVTNT